MLSLLVRTTLTAPHRAPMIAAPFICLNHTIAIIMQIRARLSIVVAALAALVLNTPAAAEKVQMTAQSGVRQVAFDRAAPSQERQAVTLHRKEAAVGDVAEQSLILTMQLKTQMRQANQLIEKNNTTVRNLQRRVVTTMAVDAGRTTAVKVMYAAAAAENIRDASTSDGSGIVPQPNEGKSYICRREPGDDGKLAITYLDGTTPPSDECEIVGQNMEMVGRPNPLAQFFDERTVAVGETIRLPKDIADQVFNLGEKFGKVTQFTLTLEKLQTENGARCAVFQAQVEAASTGASQMRLQVEGPIVLETDTCRASRIALTGPIGMSETRGSYSTSYQVMATGRMDMSVTSTYRDDRR